jgi:predicted dithiol-disulfide oxidoreductase (DUF899 family)
MIMSTATIENATPRVVSPAEWLAARKEFLEKEKELTRLRDELSRQRRELPWKTVEKKYVFEGPNGTETLVDLFNGRTQLIVYHSCSAQVGKKDVRAARSSLTRSMQ